MGFGPRRRERWTCSPNQKTAASRCRGTKTGEDVVEHGVLADRRVHADAIASSSEMNMPQKMRWTVKPVLLVSSPNTGLFVRCSPEVAMTSALVASATTARRSAIEAELLLLGDDPGRRRGMRGSELRQRVERDTQTPEHDERRTRSTGIEYRSRRAMYLSIASSTSLPEQPGPGRDGRTQDATTAGDGA